MNQNLNWVFLLAFLMIGSSGCYFGDDDDGGFLRCERGDGDTVTEEFDLSNFDGIQLTTDAEVFLTQGSEQRVTVEGPENLVDLLELDVQGDTWEIEFDRCVRDADEVKIFITIPEIRLIQVSGSGKVFGENRFNGENLDLRISGSGDMDLALDYDELDATISGSGRMRMEGAVEEFFLRISGSGDYNAFDLVTQSGEVSISGSGDVDVTVEQFLEVRISGSGDLSYRGFPVLDVSVTGSGDVINAN